MRKLLVAAIVVLMASPAFAAIQNVKVSGDITSTWINRNNFDLGLTSQQQYQALNNYRGVVGAVNPYVEDYTFVAGTDANPLGLKRQNVFITQTRVRIDADLSDNVSTTVGLINERAWGAEAVGTADTNVQLYLASLTLREFLYSPLTLTIGRQVFNYGNGLIIGDGGINNQSNGNLQFIAQDLTMRTTYDGVKAALEYKPLTIDMFYFKNMQTILTGNPIADRTSSDAYGINANYQLSDPWSTVMEAYTFMRINGNHVVTPNGVDAFANKGDTLFVPGLRASTNPIKGLNVQGEIAWQFGQHPVLPQEDIAINIGGAAEKRQAMAAQLLASYSLPVLQKYKPTVNASYTYVSGDKNGLTNNDVNNGGDSAKSAKTFTAWDSFNENQGGGTIYNSLFPLSNMHIVAIGASANPLEDVTAAVKWSGLWAADAYNAANPLAMFQPDSGTTLFYPVTRKNARGLGNETDINLTYNYTEDVTFGVSVGWFVPGTVFSSGNKNTASQALADVAVKF